MKEQITKMGRGWLDAFRGSDVHRYTSLLPDMGKRAESTWRRTTTIAVIASVAILCTIGGLAALMIQAGDAPVTYTRPPLKIAFVGDSITHGFEGDVTWRYRFTTWLKGANVEYVGPYNGTRHSVPPSMPHPPNMKDQWPTLYPEVLNDGVYAAETGKFGSEPRSRHYAIWGRAIWEVTGDIAKMVSEQQPDILLVLLGFNDLGWCARDKCNAHETLRVMKELVDNTRAVNPNMAFAIASVPQRLFMFADLPALTDEYNALLRDAIPKWSTDASPIKYVKLQENYVCGPEACPAGYDGLHPNAFGEYLIASVFAETLRNDFPNIEGMKGPFKIPDEIKPRIHSVPKNLKAEAVSGGIALTWDEVFGAFGYYVRFRVKGTDWGQHRVVNGIFFQKLVPNGVHYEYQIRVDAGDDVKTQWTEIVSAVGDESTAPPSPQNVVVENTADGFKAKWDPPAGTVDVDRYEVIYVNKAKGPGTTSFGINGTTTSCTLTGQPPNGDYDVSVVTWAKIKGGVLGGGFPRLAIAGKVAIP